MSEGESMLLSPSSSFYVPPKGGYLQPQLVPWVPSWKEAHSVDSHLLTSLQVQPTEISWRVHIPAVPE